MNIKTDLPHPTRMIENTWISMSDGCRLAARIWLPEDADQNPVPAIMDYNPYRKGDSTATDATNQRYIAGHGYAFLRVDSRGSGDSDGLLLGEYLQQELDDGVEAIAWIAAQPWCTGNVGMIGSSWAGFNGLQVASLRPPELKAVISSCSTDDRYEDELHHQGGCIMSYTLNWASTMFAYNARPPDPRNVGDRWREMWIERMENNTPWVEEWLSHPRKDEFWRHGSVAENYDDIQCPVYMVGGWTDPYATAIPRFLAGYSGPRKGLIGPWGHGYGHSKPPGPNMGWLQETLRWWDHWLKGIDTGIMDEPMLRMWMPEAVEPRVEYDERPGRWIAESTWPSENVGTNTYYLGDGTLDEAAGAEVKLDHLGSQGAGKDAGDWGAWWKPPGLPTDQNREDGLSLTFTSKPLDGRLEILGTPRVRLTVASDKPIALVAVRLCDVSPTGSSTLITRRLLNLNHRNGHNDPEPLEPGTRYSVTVPLMDMAYAVPAGHRLRVAVSPTYWPWAWPSPEPVTLSLFTGEASTLELPVRSPHATDSELRAFDPPEMAAPMEVEVLRSATSSRDQRHDDLTGHVRVHLGERSGREPSGGFGFRGRWLRCEQVQDRGGRSALGIYGVPAHRDNRPR